VKITLIPSAIGTSGPQYLTSYLVNDDVAIDAGAIGFWGTPEDQAAIRHVFVSHSHADHVASLPIFLLNVGAAHTTPVRLYASTAVQESLRSDIFNGRVWPNFLELTHERGQFVDMATIANGSAIDLPGLRVTAVSVNHVVPTLGFILEDGSSTVAIVSDTAATDEIWARLRLSANVKAVFLEATFPDAQADLAAITKHLTPSGLVGEMRKLPGPAEFFAVHLRAGCRDKVAEELRAFRLPNLQVAEFGTTYQF
jgi:ribonuclease BN (tRNA processing enzyme)